MVEEKKPAAKKAVAGTSEVKVAKSAAKKAEAAVWPFPAQEAAEKPARKVAKKAETPAAEEKKPAVKKPAAKKAAAPKAKAAEQQKIAQPSAQERYRMVETAAYYIAERSGFQGCTTDHWAAAELEIAAKLGC